MALFALSGVLSFYSCVFPSACQPGEEVDGWVWLSSLFVHLILWHEDHERHFAVVALAPVLDCLDEASESLLCLDNFDICANLALEFVDFDDTTQTCASMHGCYELVHLIKPIEIVCDELFER